MPGVDMIIPGLFIENGAEVRFTELSEDVELCMGNQE
jgi:hypothetical protein